MSGLAPAPMFPERAPNVFERSFAPPVSPLEGPNRFQEGIGTDTDVPHDFTVGAMQGYLSAPGRPNRNANVFEKYPEETMAQRAHMGSAAWVESQQFLGNFAEGASGDGNETTIISEIRYGGRYDRVNPAVVVD